MPTIARPLSPADELAELRAMIARLQRREAHLALTVEMAEPAPILRPGWPIARTYASAETASH